MKFSIQDHKEAGTIVLDSALIDQLTRGNIIDAPITLLRESPPVWILPTAMQQNGKIYLSHTLLKGYLGDLSDAEYAVINEFELFSVPDHLSNKNIGRHWITNLYHHEDGILAFLHSEYAGDDDYFGMPSIICNGRRVFAPGRSAISLAWLPRDRLDNDLFNFIYLGCIATYSASIPHFNVSGTPVFVNFDQGVCYINILFDDVHCTLGSDGWNIKNIFVSQARAPIADVIAGAKKGEITHWRKRNGEEWNDAIGGIARGILPSVEHPDHRIACGELIVHSDVAYIERYGIFVLVAYVLVQKDLNPSCLVIYSSTDGLNWKFESTFNERMDCKKGWSYVKMFDKGRRNGDRSLYCLVGWDYGKDGRCVYRLAMQISEY